VANVKEIDIPRMPNGQNKGYALIYLQSVGEVPKAIEFLDQKNYEGHVFWASNKLTNV